MWTSGGVWKECTLDGMPVHHHAPFTHTYTSTGSKTTQKKSQASCFTSKFRVIHVWTFSSARVHVGFLVLLWFTRTSPKDIWWSKFRLDICLTGNQWHLNQDIERVRHLVTSSLSTIKYGSLWKTNTSLNPKSWPAISTMKILQFLLKIVLVTAAPYTVSYECKHHRSSLRQIIDSVESVNSTLSAIKVRHIPSIVFPMLWTL